MIVVNLLGVIFVAIIIIRRTSLSLVQPFDHVWRPEQRPLLFSIILVMGPLVNKAVPIPRQGLRC